MITREEWLDWLQAMRVDLARLPDSDPRRADRQMLLDHFAAIEKVWTEVDKLDPEAAARSAGKIIEGWERS
jgi:hypothetical protein